MNWCENPECPRPTDLRKKFRDPRRGKKDEIAYTSRFCCSPECELAICDELERQATYARMVH